MKQQADTLKASPDDSVAADTAAKSAVRVFSPATEPPPADTTRQEQAPPNFFFTEFTGGMPLKERIPRPEGWISPLLLLLFFFLAMLVTYYARELKSLFLSPFRKDGLRKLNAEENFLVRRTLLSMMLIFLLTWPVLVYQTIVHTGLTGVLPDVIPVYLQVLGVCSALVVLKLLIVRLTGILFLCRREAEIYLHGIMLMFSASGVLLIPLCMVAQFAGGAALDAILWAAWVATGAAYLSGLATGAAAAVRSLSISGFHLFLYFCTLELLPAILIIKVVRNMALQG